jgi:hypothetical protein
VTPGELIARTATQAVSRAEREAAAEILGAGGDRDRVLRQAHARVRRLRETGEPVPFWLRLLEAECQGRVRKPRRRPDGLMARIRHDEAAARWDTRKARDAAA